MRKRFQNWLESKREIVVYDGFDFGPITMQSVILAVMALVAAVIAYFLSNWGLGPDPEWSARNRYERSLYTLSLATPFLVVLGFYTEAKKQKKLNEQNRGDE